MVASRGQVQTLEGVVAALLVLASLTFALQTTAVTPLSASTASQHIENQQQSVAEGILAAAAADDELKPALLYWDEDNEEFHGAASSARYYIGNPPANDIGLYHMLERRFNDHGIAYNVYAVYQTSTGEHNRQRVVFNGAPSDNAVTATRQITLYDGDNLRDPVGGGVGNGGTEVDTSHTLSSTTNYFAPSSTASDIGLYTVVRVEVVVWRM